MKGTVELEDLCTHQSAPLTEYLRKQHLGRKTRDLGCWLGKLRINVAKIPPALQVCSECWLARASQNHTARSWKETRESQGQALRTTPNSGERNPWLQVWLSYISHIPGIAGLRSFPEWHPRLSLWEQQQETGSIQSGLSSPYIHWLTSPRPGVGLVRSSSHGLTSYGFAAAKLSFCRGSR